MLLRFRLANHRSIYAEHDLSLAATEFNEGAARHTGLRSEGRPIAVLPAVGIFGANASGKSNVLSGLAAMKDAVVNSMAGWAQRSGVPRDPFALDPRAREQTTLYEVDVLLGDPPIRYTYGFELSDMRVEAEWLHAYPHGRKQVWFDREADRAEGDDFSFPGDGLKGPKAEFVALTRPNSLFLTVGASLNHPALRGIHQWFRDALVTIHPSSAHDHAATHRMLASPSGDFRSRFETLLKVADLGVSGLRLSGGDEPEKRVNLMHHAIDGTSVPLDILTQESAGTSAWFGFIGPLLAVLELGSILIIDELDASLHPSLAAEVVRLFQDRGANPNDAQLIFTSHDATLLGNAIADRPLDRDQIWITAKRKTGETELYPLIDAKPRKEENLERGYLRGRYGGIPQLTSYDLARAVTGGLPEAV